MVKGTTFVLRTISPAALFGTKSVWRGRVKVDVSDPSRTILDLLDDPILGGGIRHCADILRNYLESESKNLPLLVAYGDRLGNGAVFKRLGFLLEQLAPGEDEAVAECRRRLTAGSAKLDAALPARRLVTAWRLRIPENWVGKGSHD